jgi:ElaB/YqjD/DUF883 family membrane-anchored ribosome-binding protein
MEPEQDSAEMRKEIDCTRSAMAAKLEALENKVLGTVESAQETVEISIQSAKDTLASVKRTFNLKLQVEQRPWTMVGGCLLAGLALGTLISTRRRPSFRNQYGPAENGYVAAAAPVPLLQVEPNRPGVLDPFQKEIDKVKGMAIGLVMGLVRDSIKDSVPQMASQIDELMNGITTKIGGVPTRATLASEPQV